MHTLFSKWISLLQFTVVLHIHYLLCTWWMRSYRWKTTKRPTIVEPAQNMLCIKWIIDRQLLVHASGILKMKLMRKMNIWEIVSCRFCSQRPSIAKVQAGMKKGVLADWMLNWHNYGKFIIFYTRKKYYRMGPRAQKLCVLVMFSNMHLLVQFYYICKVHNVIKFAPKLCMSPFCLSSCSFFQVFSWKLLTGWISVTGVALYIVWNMPRMPLNGMHFIHPYCYS